MGGAFVHAECGLKHSHEFAPRHSWSNVMKREESSLLFHGVTHTGENKSLIFTSMDDPSPLYDEINGQVITL